MNAKILGTIVFVLIPSLALAQPEVRRSPVSINRVLDRVIDMPVKKVTSVMLGGPNLDVLYVTSTAKPPLPRFLGRRRPARLQPLCRLRSLRPRRSRAGLRQLIHPLLQSV
jgi:hypothetical protein